MSGAYYNDNDPFIIEYLKVLKKEGCIADGEIDPRPIQEVDAKDLKGFKQVHLFAGIAAWSLALFLARWPDERPAWTVSCPCPPFSVAGKRQCCPECEGENLIACPSRTGFFICCSCAHAWNADPRHLFPEVWRLVRDAQPDCPIFGEQVSSEGGRDWLAMLRASMEILDYDTWGADICSAGVGKDHIRQRIGWVAYAEGPHGRRKLQEERERRGRGRPSGSGASRGVEQSDRGHFRSKEEVCAGGSAAGFSSEAGGMEYADRDGRQKGKSSSSIAGHGASSGSASGRLERLGESESGRRRERGNAGEPRQGGYADSAGQDHRRMADAADGQLQKSQRGSKERNGSGSTGPLAPTLVGLGYPNRPGLEGWSRRADQYPDQWYLGSAGVPILCGDGKWRRVPASETGEPEPTLFPLADAGSFRNRVGILRGAGNTIDPILFSLFIEAAKEAIGF